MAQPIEEECMLCFYFACLCLILIYKYPRMIHLQWIIMVLSMPVYLAMINALVLESEEIFLQLALFVLVEYMTFSHLLQNYQDSKKKSKIVSAI